MCSHVSCLYPGIAGRWFVHLPQCVALRIMEIYHHPHPMDCGLMVVLQSVYWWPVVTRHSHEPVV